LSNFVSRHDASGNQAKVRYAGKLIVESTLVATLLEAQELSANIIAKGNARNESSDEVFIKNVS
jgi:hypothetical protein